MEGKRIGGKPLGLMRRIVADSPGLGDAHWRGQVAALRTAPPFVVQRLWLDRPVDADRPAFLGTGGLEPVDNISVVSNYERQAAEWARAHGGSVVEVHSYSVVEEPPFDGLSDRTGQGGPVLLHVIPGLRPSLLYLRRTGPPCPALSHHRGTRRRRRWWVDEDGG